MKAIVASLTLAALLAGCAAGNVSEIRTDPANAVRIEIDQNYQRVYKNVLDKMHECIGESWAGMFAQVRIRHALYSDLQEGNIGYVMDNLGVANHYLQVDIKGLPNNRTRLEAFVHFSTWKAHLERVQAWAIDGRAPCEATHP